MKSDLIDIDATAIHLTDRAILVTTDGENKVWLPLARIDIHHRGRSNDYTVTLPRSLAEEKGLV